MDYRRRNYVDDPETIENINHLAEFIVRGDSKFGVMLCGTPGNGKTTMLYAFQSAVNWLSDLRNFGDQRCGISIVDAKDVVYAAKNVDEFRKLIKRPMLAIEDMGREPAEILEFGNTASPVIDLLEYRYNNQLFTFITTNLTPAQIREKYGNRIADRFNEMMETIVFKNGTYRN